MRVADLDTTILQELVDLGPDEGIGLVRDLVQIFFSEAPNRLLRLRAGLAQSDSNQVAQAAHAMNGGAGGIGAVGLASLCSSIERQARTGDLTGLEAEIEHIADALPGLEARLGKLVRKLGASAD